MTLLRTLGTGMIASLVMAGCSAPPAVPEPDPAPCMKRADYDIPAQRFDETAQRLAHATGCFVQADLSRVGAVPVNAVHGRFTIQGALDHAIADTPLRRTGSTPRRITIEPLSP